MRECGSCNLCCKVIAVQALAKPTGVWCQHAKPGAGCTIYGKHPGECKTFECSWLSSPDLGEEWKPSTSRFVILKRGNGIFVHVDANYPGAWRKPAYYSLLKKTSEAMWTGTGQVLIYEGRKTTVIYPEEDLYVGELEVGDTLHAGYIATPFTRQPHAKVETREGEKYERRGGVYPNRVPI